MVTDALVAERRVPESTFRSLAVQIGVYNTPAADPNVNRVLPTKPQRNQYGYRQKGVSLKPSKHAWHPARRPVGRWGSCQRGLAKKRTWDSGYVSQPNCFANMGIRGWWLLPTSSSAYSLKLWYFRVVDDYKGVISGTRAQEPPKNPLKKVGKRGVRESAGQPAYISQSCVSRFHTHKPLCFV